ncbi:TIGR03067 domain-containing protein [Frigoriglobus tundricola]|uniref:TIGR03067 domain-containing protein n=1 Tax=Frigoriglobus tundricola TaxID=2774151 RepID=A0A6M5YYU1_9BACT|nr:TIGR03067 domain-containing protein [Frigoriglobus tundricola]QJW98630.1 hypothetical protein FTUN_6225 [Frigoriglobus tundricola]
MRLCLPLLMLLGSVAVADDPKPAPKDKELSADAKKELTKLDGKWKLVKVASGGQEGDVDKEVYFEFKGTELTMSAGSRSEAYRIAALDPATDPRCVDLVEKRPGKPDRTLEGVYRIDGDTLQLAHALPGDGKNRPTGFDKSLERGMVWTLKRVKE